MVTTNTTNNTTEPSVRSWDSLDLIALQTTFELLLPPNDLLDPSLTAGRDSPWCKAHRMKQNLTLVSKYWRDIAIWFLYREVVFRRVSQVISFSKLCATEEFSHRSLVRSVQFMCYIPDDMRNTYSDAVATILHRCDRLSDVTFGPTLANVRNAGTIAYANTSYDYELWDVVRNVGSRISRIRILDQVDFNAPTSRVYPPDFLRSFPVLTSLALPLLPNRAWTAPAPDIPWISDYFDLRLERLEEMTIPVGDVGEHFDITSRWDLPALRRVTLDGGMHGHNHPPTNRLMAFFKSHGSKVKELDLRCTYRYRGWRDQIPLNCIVALCPCLSYIALSCSVWNPSELDQLLPTIDDRPTRIYVDVWVEDGLDDKLPYLFPLGFVGPRPNVRLIDMSLTHLPNITRSYPPGPPGLSDSPIFHDLFGLCIVQMQCGLFRLGFDWALYFPMQNEAINWRKLLRSEVGTDSEDKSSSTENDSRSDITENDSNLEDLWASDSDDANISYDHGLGTDANGDVITLEDVEVSSEEDIGVEELQGLARDMIDA